jgi:hypothetical protein
VEVIITETSRTLAPVAGCNENHGRARVSRRGKHKRRRNLLLPVLLAGLIVAAGWSRDDRPSARGSAPSQGPSAVTMPWDVVFTQIPAGRVAGEQSRASGMLAAQYGEGARIVRLSPTGAVHVLTPQFHSAADPAVSFDGTRILFAGKPAADSGWNIYEMNADGSHLRQITHDVGNCRSPVYQSPIFYLDDPGPMPQIAFVSDAPAEISQYGAVAATALYSARLDGSGVRRLTYNPSGAFDPTMLPDGRLLFAGWERNDSTGGLRGRIELLATNIDGTDYATFSGGQGPRIKRMACVTARRLVIFVAADAVSWDGAGPLGAIDLRRNLYSYRRLLLPASYLFHSPSPLPDGSVLVSRRPANGRGTHGIFRLDPESGKLDAIFIDPRMHNIQAQALVERAVPDGRSSVVDEKQSWSRFYCLNVYETDLDRRLWPAGSVKRVRVVEGLPSQASDAAQVRSLSPLLGTRLLGELDVDNDGSFHIEVPPNLPIQIQALDENGMALRSSAWIWAKNREQRGCIGCHEDGERTPENVMATALTRPAAMLMLPSARRRSVDFERDVAPILAQKCAAACHSGAAQPRLSGRGARFGAAYEGLLTRDSAAGPYRYVTPGVARTSPLVWAIFGRNTSRPWDHMPAGSLPKAMPPEGAAPLTRAEKRAIVEWIDLGAHYGRIGGQP